MNLGPLVEEKCLCTNGKYGFVGCYVVMFVYVMFLM